MKKSLLLVVIALTCMFLFVACGQKSTTRLTKAEFIAQSDNICRDMGKQGYIQEKRAGLELIDNPTAAQWAKIAKIMKIVEGQEISRLKGLRPPSELETDVTAWLKGEDHLLGVWDDVSAAAKTGKTKAVEKVLINEVLTYSKADALAKKIGLKVCGWD